MNKESGRNKKRREIHALNDEGKKITDEQTITEILTSILLPSQKTLKDKIKIILLMMITIIWIVIPISWNKLLKTLPKYGM